MLDFGVGLDVHVDSELLLVEFVLVLGDSLQRVARFGVGQEVQLVLDLNSIVF